MVRQRKTKTAATVSTGPQDEIPEDEQWRLINESGVLKHLQTTSLDQTNTVDDSDFSLAEEIFDAAIYIIPISFLLLLMEILIHLQYGKHPSLNALTDRMLPGVPIISICVFYTTRHKKRKEVQLFLFVLGVLSGCRMIYLLNRGSWLVNMKQCPPLATAWVYTIVQLDLLSAIASLGVVGGFLWWQGLSLNP